MIIYLGIAKGIVSKVDYQGGGLHCISQIIHKYEENETIQKLSLTLLNQISTRTTTRVSVAREFGVAKLMNLLFAWEKNQEIQIMCLKVIDVLCTLSLCRRRLAQEGRLQLLINWLCENVQERVFISCGLNIFHKLSISGMLISYLNHLIALFKDAFRFNCELTFSCINSNTKLVNSQQIEGHP
jgi:hypothetical protein